MVAVAIGGAAIVGGATSMAASSKASKTAKNTAAANNALQRKTYDRNAKTLSPYVEAGNAATPAIQALLGLASPNSSVDWEAYARSNPGIGDYYLSHNGRDLFTKGDAMSLAEYGKAHYDTYGAANGIDLTPYRSTSNPGEAQMQALNNFRNSAGYQDQFAEGQRAVTTALGNRGLLDSGAAQKALVKYGTYQANQSLGDYLNRLVQQQGVGLSAASAQAGVGQNYANAVSANNSNAANAAANAALSNAGNINSVLQSGVSAYGFSQGMGSSYGGGASLTGQLPPGAGTPVMGGAYNKFMMGR